MTRDELAAELQASPGAQLLAERLVRALEASAEVIGGPLNVDSLDAVVATAHELVGRASLERFKPRTTR